MTTERVQSQEIHIRKDGTLTSAPEGYPIGQANRSDLDRTIYTDIAGQYIISYPSPQPPVVVQIRALYSVAVERAKGMAMSEYNLGRVAFSRRLTAEWDLFWKNQPKKP